MKTIQPVATATYVVGVPEIEEQQKIATFLGSVDAKLNKLRRKRERLETWGNPPEK